MMNNKRIRISAFLCLALALILLSPAVYSLGVSPSRTVIDYEEGKVISGDLTILNNERKNLDILVYPRGDFEEYVELDQQTFKMNKDQTELKVPYSINLPGFVNTPGLHRLEIVSVGSSIIEGGGSSVKADLAVISQFDIEVPYPDKYAEANVYIPDVPEGSEVEISIPIFNKGSETLIDAFAKVEIFDASGNLVYSKTTTPESIRSGKHEKIILRWSQDVPIGKYKAITTLVYDGQEKVYEKEFEIGKLAVDIRSVVVDRFRLGDIAKFDILLFNDWNQLLRNVHAEVTVSDQSGNEFSRFRTVATDMKPQSVGRLEGFWFTEDVPVGVYTLHIALFYANKVSEKAFSIEVLPNSITVKEGLITGQAISEEEISSAMSNFYMTVIILSLVVIIIILLFVLRKKRGQDEEDLTIEFYSEEHKSENKEIKSQVRLTAPTWKEAAPPQQEEDSEKEKGFDNI